MPHADTQAMSAHLAEIAKTVASGERRISTSLSILALSVAALGVVRCPASSTFLPNGSTISRLVAVDLAVFRRGQAQKECCQPKHQRRRVQHHPVLPTQNRDDCPNFNGVRRMRSLCQSHRQNRLLLSVRMRRVLAKRHGEQQA